MTEPVAWRIKDGNLSSGWRYSSIKPVNKRDITEPLYTAEQLHPRVKMTQAEFDEFKILKSLNPTADLIAILKTVSNFKYKNLQSRFVCGSIENQIEFATLWLRCRYERLEELIEIEPDMKWFVRSKSSGEKYGYWYLHKTERFFFHEYIKELSTQFDTKEEAEKWTNPLTEAVQLPVEGE